MRTPGSIEQRTTNQGRHWGRTASNVELNYHHAHTGRRGDQSRNEVLDLGGQDCGEGHLSEGTI